MEYGGDTGFSAVSLRSHRRTFLSRREDPSAWLVPGMEARCAGSGESLLETRAEKPQRLFGAGVDRKNIGFARGRNLARAALGCSGGLVPFGRSRFLRRCHLRIAPLLLSHDRLHVLDGGR